MAQTRVSHTRQQHGWETTSQDYHVHVSRIERTPSVLPDAPRYPNVFRAFNNRVTREEEPEEIIHQERLVQKQQTPTKPHKKVHVEEKEQIIFQDNSGKCEVVEESIDAETDGFIQQKRKGFELCKWKTFKMH